MKIPLFQVDAFTDKLFHGNPAAVCVLEKWLDDTSMQQIAMENNLSETAFVVREKNAFYLRWFTPKVEVELCGHATLATAHVLFTEYRYKENEIVFHSKYSGILKVRKEGAYLTLDFPAQPIKKTIPPDRLLESMGKEPQEIYKGKTDYLLVYENEHEVQSLTPDFNVLSHIDMRGVIATAKGEAYDFVSRFFAPAVGINEDSVTGSAHTILIPYWRKKLKKEKLSAKQLSARQGFLKCRQRKRRVMISGQAVTFLKGELVLPSSR